MYTIYIYIYNILYTVCKTVIMNNFSVMLLFIEKMCILNNICLISLLNLYNMDYERITLMKKNLL